MKKILHIQVIPKLSGVQKISLEIFKHLPDEEYEKWILFSNATDVGDKDVCHAEFEKAGVKVLFLDSLRREIGIHDIKGLCDIYRLCKVQKFDIVHTHSTKPGFIGRVAATLAGVPLVIHTVHGLSFHKFVKFPKWQFYWICEMFSALFCKKIVLVNNYYMRYFKWFKKKTSVIYNGIDFTQYSESKEKQQHKQEDGAKILFVGRLDVPKDPITFLKGAKKVLESKPNTIFTMVGDGEKYEECRAYIINNNLDKQIHLEGWQKDVATYYETHDIFCLSSIYEAFGLIFLEAGYHHLPTVATNVEGIPEVIEDGVTGLLVPPQRSDLFADKILYLIVNQEKRREMGDCAYERVVGLFSAQRMRSQYINLYS